MDTDTIRQQLRDEIKELQTTSATSADSRSRVDLDQQSVGRLSRMDAMQQQSMALAAEKRRQGRIARLEAALKRLDSGDYGYCVRCGDEIDEKRLDADPSAPVCSACAGA
ncbi:MAG: TraR/DksA family transcriptional regulator [Alphaproteobacteria bacterium]